MAQEQLPAGPQFREIVLAAPDIGVDEFHAIAQQVKSTANRVTLYASSKDRALQAAERIAHRPRAGQSASRMLVVEGIDMIDATAVDTSLIGHSYYGDNRTILSDLFRLIREACPGSPITRFGIVAIKTGDAHYWKFRP
jgi:esterase/lipase superfamily enzyme